MSTQTVDELRKIEKTFVKLRNKIKRADLDYVVQVSINSTDPKTVIYAVQMTAPANGLSPVRILASSAPELVAKIKVANENIDMDAVEVAYHKAQIESCDRTKLGHQERIDEIEGKSVNESNEEVKENEVEK